MKWMPFAGKMILIGAIFVIPIVLLLVVLFVQLKSEVDFAAQEQIGVQYTRALRPLFYDLEIDRVSTSAMRAAVERRIGSDFEVARKVDAGAGAPLQLHTALGALERNWRSRAPRDTVVRDFLALLVLVSDNSKITLDPILDGYYVGDTMVDKVPNLIDAVAGAEATGARIVRARAMRQDDRIAVTMLSGQASAARDGIARNVPIAIAAAPYLEDGLRLRARRADVAASAFISRIRTDVLEPARPRGNARVYGGAARSAYAAAFDLYDGTIAGMDDVLRTRIASLVGRAEVIFGVVIALILGAAGVTFTTTRSIARRLGDVTSAIQTIVSEDVAQLVEIANAIARGDAGVAAVVRRPLLPDSGRDEASVLARSYNSLVERLADVNADFVKMTTLLSSLAFHDVLTGLANRALFMDRIKQMIARNQRRTDQFAAVLFIDLDRFKLVNDSLGHGAGDELLVAVAQRLQRCLRAGDTLARLGGDEFTILLEDIRGECDAVAFAERVLAEFVPPFLIGSREMFASGSIGIAVTRIGYDLPEDIVRDADIAMYRAKHQGKNRYAVFAPELLERASSLLQLETDLMSALERREFVLYYQPIVRLDDNALQGFEALVRWQHPERGLLSPDAFIPVAEENGAILALGAQVLELAARQSRRWQDRFGAPGLSISVNVSARQFSNPGLVDQIKSVLGTYDLAPDDLHIEITESAIMGNPDVAAQTLAELRTIGVEVHLDDFGTGYSSLAYLQRFPVSTIKIDRSFVGMSGSGVSNPEIVRAVTSLAQSLSMKTTAEGIETPEQLVQLRELSCTNGQGYHFSRPLTAEHATDMIARSSLNRAAPSAV